MIRSFGVPEDDIGFWAGLAWGRLSDRIGRKPAIIFGLAAMLSCTIVFGFSTSVQMAMLTRCLVGLLNGNVGILRTVVAELVPEKELQPQAFSLLPLAWNVGSIIGPAIGGFLSEPAQKYPIAKGGFFEKHPWALPNLFIAAISFIGCLLGFLFLEETLPAYRRRYDPGREIGKRIEALFYSSNSQTISKTSCDLREAREHNRSKPLTWSQILTPSSIRMIILYVLVAIHHITYEQILAVLLATKVHPESDPISLPFHLPGGFGLTTSQIGLVFSVIGLNQIIAQLGLFPKLARKYGVRKLLLIPAFFDPVFYLLVPYTLALNGPVLYVAWGILIPVTSVSIVCTLTSCVILATNTAPSAGALATLNGLSTSFAALGFTIGPSLFGWLFSVGQKSELSILPWIGLSTVALSMWIWLPKVEEERSNVDDENDSEATGTDSEDNQSNGESGSSEALTFGTN
ncbi:hypothetical protein TWF694_006728 [Orbilia ellipsospora]|uniref:Major facilitator superfamily (MFS) profile domain-containing protein n=1 Tax=Orbilia ellipsospora TaxID=2528407 RepID=A0AAV9XMD0_9PEZI